MTVVKFFQIWNNHFSQFVPRLRRLHGRAYVGLVNNIGPRERQYLCPGSPSRVSTTVPFGPEKNITVATLERICELLANVTVCACGAACSQECVEIMNTTDVYNFFKLMLEHLPTDLMNA